MHATRRLTAAAAVVPLIVLSTASGASAAPFSFSSDVLVSGASTLTACPFGASADFASAYDNTEVEPQVAVNPTNPNEMIGVTQ